jgi:hypothetical protein
MGTVAVIELDVDSEDLLEVGPPDNEEPFQALGADRPLPALCIGVRLGACTGVTSTSPPWKQNASSAARVNLSEAAFLGNHCVVAGPLSAG